jgi:hypothetical protein
MSYTVIRQIPRDAPVVCVRCGCDWLPHSEMRRLRDGSWQCASETDCLDTLIDQEFFDEQDREAGRAPGEVSPDAIPLEDCPELIAAFETALAADAMARALPKPGPHYLQWTGIPGRDWAPPSSLACRERRTTRRCRAAARERFRRLRACVRVHPSDGPPAAVAAPGVPVIFP